MRAPVYRNIDAQNTFLGLAFPGEVLLVFGAFFASMVLMRRRELSALGLTIGVYAAVRLVNHGRAQGFLQHWAAWQLRRLVGGGLFSPTARSRAPRFPFASYVWRDLPPRDRS